MKKTFLIIIIILLTSAVCCTSWHYLTLPPKIAILYIATGRYFIFWPEFYESAEKNFLPNYEKHYYVFTDNEFNNRPKNATKIYRKWHGYPLDTLDRYEMFLSIEKELKKYDYIYFLNANSEIVGTVGEEIFPTKQQGIMVTCGPEYCRTKNKLRYPYERNPRSMAYIAPHEGVDYIQGGFVGGLTKPFLDMCRHLDKNIKIDKINGIIARFDDESHLNRYVIGKNFLIMPPNYIWWLNADPVLQEQYKADNSLKIIMKEKNDKKYGGRDYLRTKKSTLEEQDMEHSYAIKQEKWTDYLVLENRLQKRFCRRNAPDCATIERKKDLLTIHWENQNPMTFVFDHQNGEFIPLSTNDN